MEQINWNEITRESLDELTIFATRTLARELGVPSPTKLKKQEMIDQIIQIKEGSMKPQENATKRGRPPKKSDIDSSLDSMRSVAPTVEPEARAEQAQSEAVSPQPVRKEQSRPQQFRSEQVRRPSEGYRPQGERNNYFRNNNNADYILNKKPQLSSVANAVPDEEIYMDSCELRSGILEILPDGYGFLRASNFRNSPKDSYVSVQKIKRCGLRQGDYIKAFCKVASEGKPLAVISVSEVNGKPADKAYGRPNFDSLIPIFPNQKLKLEIPNIRNELAVRAIDLISPIGKGQRAMLVSPPKAGKTTLLKMVAKSIALNHPEVKLMVLLIDERPEEETDMQRSINGEVIYSTFDEESDNHIKVAELVLARAKRLVEYGEDVVILLDSLTRLARANNVVVPSSGKTLSGGVDPVSLYFPKRFFGAARNIENGGSLTIIATALIDTGSRMDDVVYEEFKGTGNMEIHLDRKLSEKRIFPAIDLNRSGTRKEELLLTQKELEGAYAIRKLLSAGDNQEAAEHIINLMLKFPTNEELIKQLNLQLAMMQKEGFRS